MTLRTLILTGFILTILSCNSNSSNPKTLIKTDTTSPDIDSRQSDTQQNTNEQYVAINLIIQKGDTIFLDANYIQYLTGDAAV